MGFFGRLKAIRSQTAFEHYIQQFVTGEDLPDAITGMSQEVALKQSAFFACCRVLAETFASVSIKEYKQDLKTGDREQTNDTGLYPILHFQPNDETCRYSFQECMMNQINTGGNFVAQRLMNGRKLVGLSQIEYQDYDISRDKTDNKIKYRLNKTGGQDTLDRDQVLHIPGPTVDGIIGMSALTYASSSILLGKTYEMFGQKFYNNGATPSGVFEKEGMLKAEAATRLKQDLKKNYAGLLNAGKPMLLEDGLKWRGLTINPIDAELLSSKKFQIEEICRFLRVPPHLVQHLEKATFNNIEQLSLEFVMYTMLPHFKRAEDNINCQLLSLEQRSKGYYMEYNMAALLRGDQKTMAEYFAKGIQWGWLSVNDVRKLLNLNKVEGGDTYLKPLNMVPIEWEPEKSGKPSDSANKTVDILMNQATGKGNI